MAKALSTGGIGALGRTRARGTILRREWLERSFDSHAATEHPRRAAGGGVIPGHEGL
ncbi:MAG TPA: hypothetical protein VIP46_13605 [Pyrinomonadaceae bacterium]